MRQVQIFSGSSHPTLVADICERLGSVPAKADLGKFSNGETKVQLNTSIREQDVFIVQSGSDKINDNVMELLIMCSACKSGSAKSVTAVMPYFPYSRQSKKKSHRGSITARMVANLLDVAGVNHVITIDLHANQMQGFFHCPVDNLVAEPLIAHWIKSNIPDWRRAVVVSKNPGGTKRVTSLADALKLNFGIVMTDRARPGSGRTSMAASTILEPRGTNGSHNATPHTAFHGFDGHFESHIQPPTPDQENGPARPSGPPGSPLRPRAQASPSLIPRSPRQTPQEYVLTRTHTAPSALRESEEYSTDEDDEDPRNRDVVTGRLIHGHIVDDNVPSPAVSAMSTNTLHAASLGNHLDDDDAVPDHMLSSVMSSTSSYRHGAMHHNGLGGSGDAVASDDDEEDFLMNPELESTVTLVGNVRDRPVILLDDMIDKCASWVAAAETVVKRGGATKVYCMATHGIFGGDCLEEMEECDCIDGILVTNTFPIPEAKRRHIRKLEVIDVSGLLAEAIRRNHHGESIERLYGYWD